MEDYEADIQWRKKNNMTIYREDIPTRADVIRRDDPKYIWENAGLTNHHHNTIKYTDRKENLDNGYSCSDRDSAGSYSNYTQYRILIDFKPKLDSISGIIGQLKVYRDCIGPSDLMIITYDKNEKYDPILKDENIKILRVDEETDELYIPSRQTTIAQ